MGSSATKTWQSRYRVALRRLNIGFAIAAFVYPFLFLGFIALLERTGLCIMPNLELPSGSCSFLGWNFGPLVTEILLPTALGIVTLTCLVMSGVGTFIYLVWSILEK